MGMQFEKSYEQLINSLEKSVGFKVFNSKDCLNLKREIEKKTLINISISTYRRLFGLIKKNTNFSKQTLDLFSVLCGFSDWYEFNYVQTNNQTETKNQLLNNQFVDPENFKLKIPVEINSWENANWVYTIILQAIYIKNYNILLEIFDNLKQGSNKEQFDDYMSFITQPICLACYRGDKELIHFINCNLKNLTFIDFVIRESVFEDKLKDYYGNWIIEIKKLEKYKNDIFILLMQLQIDFIDGKIEEAKRYLKEINIIYFSSSKQIHPILSSRIAAWEIILFNKLSNKSNAIFENLTIPEKMTFLIFYSKLIWEYIGKNNNFPLFEWFKKIPETTPKTFIDQGRKACYLTHLCYYNLINNNKTPQIFEQINTQLFYISDYQFYSRIYKEIISNH
jgi:hypothetical protein